MAEKNGDYLIHTDLLDLTAKTAHDAVNGRVGFFHRGLKRFMPQWNLPKDVEYHPQRIEVAEPKKASHVLMTRNFCDRGSVSSFLNTQVLRTWHTQNKRWIFSPDEVIKRSAEEIGLAFARYFHYNYNTPGPWYLENMQKLISRYDGDPRNIIQGKNVEDALVALREFKGFGPGISGMYLMEMNDRRIACPTNPNELVFKIDRHKQAIPMQTKAVTLKEGVTKIHHGILLKPLREAYLESCRRQRLDNTTTDNALWVIGSEGCAKMDYSVCQSGCPLFDICHGCVKVEEKKGFFTLVGEDGGMPDVRKNKFLETHGQFEFK